MTMDLRLGRWQDALADVGEVDCVITDPPYGARTHEAQVHGAGYNKKENPTPINRRALSYAHFTPQDVSAFCGEWSPRCRGWFVAFTSHDLVDAYAAALERTGRYVFAPLPCVLAGMTVRLAGDGPSSWTVWLVVARWRTRQARSWGTLDGAYVCQPGNGVERSKGHIGGKPLGLMRAIIRDYSKPGDLICDPCAGGGTTLLAAAMEGRRAIGAEMDPKTYELAKKRLARGYTPGLFQGVDV